MLTIQNIDSDSGQLKIKAPEDYRVRIFATFPGKTSIIHKQTIINSGLVGGQTDFISAQKDIVFKNLKFNLTSKSMRNQKAHLVLIIERLWFNEQSGKVEEYIVFSRISPGVYLDSRSLSSSKKHKQKKRKALTHNLHHLFPPEYLTKDFIKKGTRTSSKIENKIILNSLEGLYNYLTAANIRNKSVNPLFLAIRFSSCYLLYFNREIDISRLQGSEINVEEQSSKLFSLLLKAYETPKTARRYICAYLDGEDNLLKFKIKKILSSNLELNINYFTAQTEVPSNFQEIEVTVELISSIKERLIEMDDSSFCTEENNNNNKEEYSHKYSGLHKYYIVSANPQNLERLDRSQNSEMVLRNGRLGEYEQEQKLLITHLNNRNSILQNHNRNDGDEQPLLGTDCLQIKDGDNGKLGKRSGNRFKPELAIDNQQIMIEDLYSDIMRTDNKESEGLKLVKSRNRGFIPIKNPESSQVATSEQCRIFDYSQNPNLFNLPQPSPQYYGYNMELNDALKAPALGYGAYFPYVFMPQLFCYPLLPPQCFSVGSSRLEIPQAKSLVEKRDMQLKQDHRNRDEGGKTNDNA